MNGQIALAPSFGPSEARRLTNEVKRDAESLWRKLVELHEGGAHTALGYSSWAAYCREEFGFGSSHAYRLLDAGRIAAAVPQLGNEAQARELTRLDGEAELTEVWHELCDDYGAENVTAAVVREAVEKRLGPPKPPKALPPPAGDQLCVAQATIRLAYRQAARLVAEWLEEHPGEDRERVCKVVAQHGWQELEARVRELAQR